ncbi:CTLH LisH motif, WD40/YVTN repeat-like-containing domain, Topless family [Artemisia annua]|uniref:CTLH LisH motif, WD40/YVTN repeat-like-containing domain, Topless family n=1 Tax=Artemisia annua TaxID=35608 RepID=A0A2U1MCF0_ARTAN|nr:CTLH LisH motif, WD40/YVTN repeat-like-containing domain, Topless family [Artemisia annua]
MRHFEELVMSGDWDEVESYLAAFTKLEDNRYSMKIYFEIRKQKYLEALDKKNGAAALEILVKDLKVFAAYNEDIFKELNLLLTLENFSLNWQHQLCQNPKPNPDIKTLFVDHTCGQSHPNGARTPSSVTNPLMGSVPKPAGFPPLGAHGPFQSAPPPMPSPLTGWMANPSSVPHPSVFAGPFGFAPANNSAMITHPRTPPTNNPAVDYQTADSEHASKRMRTLATSNEVNHMPVNILPVGHMGQSHGQSSNSSDDLPKVVMMTLNQGSAVKSMDFNPVQQALLLVGTSNGETMIWELGSKEKRAHKNFKVWDLGASSMPLQASLTDDNTASINRVKWSPNGTLFGVAYSKHIVQLYSYHGIGGDDVRNHLEIEAHVGSVNDLAFSHPNKQLCIVTCGDDRLIKVWDAVTGTKQYTFEGHEAPVYSVCPHYKENIQFLLSTATDGKIKSWLYDTNGSRVDYDAPGHSSTRMAYSADGTRLFSCGTNKEGDSFIVEWNEVEGARKHSYQGLKRSVEVVQFDTTKNRYLAAGDECLIKFWDMDNDGLLKTHDANGGLPASPCLKFNKAGTLLAVSTNENGIKILANVDGINLLRMMQIRALGVAAKARKMSMLGAASTSVGPSEDRVTPMPSTVMMNGDNPSPVNVKPRIEDITMENSEIRKSIEITEPAQCRSIRLPDNTSSAMRVSRLIYTNSGLGILALAANAVHKLWKWTRNDGNLTAKATTSVIPQLWQPTSGILMTNDISDANPEDAVHCIALSKNDAYVVSASGGKVSLFNITNFKTLHTFMAPPPAATFLAFSPLDNNIMAIGMEDSSIEIYHVRVNEVKMKLEGHNKRITGLAFSDVLNVLVSAGADSQLCVWNTSGWEKQTSKQLQIPAGRVSAPLAETRVQFHKDQTHLLAVHETQIAVYEAPRLESPKQWFPPETSSLITDATYSCDSQSIFVGFKDGRVAILASSTLTLRCRISSAAYLPNNSNVRVHPLVIAAHPHEADQFALGLSDGGVCVLEPLESEGKWGTSPKLENGAGPSGTTPSAASTADQAQS